MKCNNNYVTVELKEDGRTKLNESAHRCSNKNTAIIRVYLYISCEREVCICFYMYVFFLFETKTCYFNIESLALSSRL